MNFPQIFYYSALLSAACISIYLFRKVKAWRKFLCILIILTFVSEAIAKLISYTNGYNSVVYHFFTPIEYAIYGLVFLKLLPERMKHVILGSIVLLAALEILNTIFFQSIRRTNTNTILIESVFLVFLSLFLFKKIATDWGYVEIGREGVFIFNVAVLFYYACSCLIWGFHSYMIKRIPIMSVYNFLLIFSGLLYLTYSMALYVDVKRIARVKGKN